MKKIAGILKLLLVVSLLIGSIGSDVVLADNFETNSINVVGAKASNQIELGTVGADGKNVAATNRARTVSSYKTSEKAFSVDVSKATGSRYSVLGFDAGGKKIVDSGWQTGKTYTLGKDVASYRLLFSYSDNRSLSSADTLKFENCLTLSTVQNSSSVIEVGTIGADGKNVAATNRARTVSSYKTSEKAFSVDVSKATGSRYSVLGFDAGGKKIVDSGWQTGKTYTLGKDVASYRLLFSYSDNRSLSSADTLKFENCLTLSTVQNSSSVIEVGTIGADGKNVAATNRARTVTSDDSINGISYEVGYPTAEYSLYLLMLIKDAMNQQQGRNSRIPPMRLRRPFERYFGEGENTLETILPKMIGEFSLKIVNTSGNYKSLNILRKMKTSFEFEFMYKTGNSLVEFLDILDMFPMDNGIRSRTSETQIDTPPLRKYTEDVVDYYKQALASNDPYIKYISFYHVMEYFYDEVFKRKMVTDLKNKITHPDFSYKDEDKIYEIAMFVKNRLRMNDETGQGNELESLKYVLNEYVSVDDLKARINIIDSNALNYYQNNKVAFCNASVIGWSDSQGVFTQLAKRIYFTRNSLVHSKSGKNKERYRPYQDEKQLQLEIPLVKAVAEAIIINSSEII